MNYSITILDEDYPKRFNNYYRPPLVIYYRGDLSLLHSTGNNISLLNSKSTCNYATEALLQIITGIATGGVTAVVVPVTDGGMLLASHAIKCGLKVIAVSDRALDSDDYSSIQKAALQDILHSNGICRRYIFVRLYK